MRLVITGLLNKQVGAELGMAEKTVKTHRGHVMQKLGVTSVAELIGVVKKVKCLHWSDLRLRSHSVAML